jgi:glycosyltransferase involved in cell wall biosynthesis
MTAGASARVTICVPVYNRGEVVERAVRSVEAQTLPAAEIVAVDDGSTDDTARALERLERAGRLRLVRQRNAGVSSARNTAIRHATGDWIVPLDADDELDPRALEKALAAVDRVPGAAWCICDIVRVGAEGEEVFTSVLPPGPSSTWLAAALERNFAERTILLRRSMLLEVGGYDEDFRCFEDWELNIRMLRRGVIPAYAPGALYRYIKTQGSITSDIARIVTAHEQIQARHHRPLARAGDPVLRKVYARRLRALGREYADHLGRPVDAARCLAASLLYDFDLPWLLRMARARLGGPPQ